MDIIRCTYDIPGHIQNLLWEGKWLSVFFEYYKVFYFVAKYRNITKAAEILSLTQPSVTRTIQNLESQLGCQLFTRTKKGVTLTNEGEMIYQRVFSACELLFSAEEELEQLKSANEGIVKIGTDDLNIRQSIFISLFRKYKEKYPHVRLRIMQMDAFELENALGNGTIDFCLLANCSIDTPAAIQRFKATTQLQMQSLGKYPDAIIVGKKYSFLAEHEISFRELEPYPLIAWAPGTATNSFLDELFKEYGMTFRPMIELANIEFQILLTEQNFGYSFVPFHCVEERI